MKTISIILEDSIHEELEVFARLETSRKKSTDVLDYNKERSEALDEKYGVID